MQLEHTFTVPLPPDEAYRTLLDLQTVAACFPGAQLEEVTGDVFEGRVKVKLGPVTVLYRGQGRFLERDEAQRRVVIDARGRDNRGSSTAAATVTARVAEHAEGAQVTITTDMDVTGPPAQLAGGAMQDVSNRLLERFVSNLRAHVAGEDTQPAAEAGAALSAGTLQPATAGAGGATAPALPAADDDQLDVFDMLLGPDQTRLIGVGLVGLLLGLLLCGALRRRPVQVTITDERWR